MSDRNRNIRKFIETICEEELDLHEYYEKLPPVLSKVCIINGDPVNGVMNAVKQVVMWENGLLYGSLESNLHDFIHSIELIDAKQNI